jgi:hypothetical protein
MAGCSLRQQEVSKVAWISRNIMTSNLHQQDIERLQSLLIAYIDSLTDLEPTTPPAPSSSATNAPGEEYPHGQPTQQMLL